LIKIFGRDASLENTYTGVLKKEFIEGAKMIYWKKKRGA